MTVTDKETPQELNELVKAKLDAFARKQQFEGEIAGKYGYLSTPREEMITKIKSKWWDTPDGQAVRDLVRERGGDPADLSMIQKSHGQAFAAIGRLDGSCVSFGLSKREIQALPRPPDLSVFVL